MELRLNHLAIHLTFERLSLTVVLLKTYDNFNEISRVQNSIFQNFLMDLFIYKFQWLWCSFQFFFFFLIGVFLSISIIRMLILDVRCKIIH